jgi:cytochrome c-type biogenesis protein CcmE
MTGRPRLVIALAVASLLSVFLVYTSFAGSSELYVSVGQLHGDVDGAASRTVQLTGHVVSHREEGGSLRMVLRDAGRRGTTVPVTYEGSVPDAFREGRQVVVRGRLEDGVFVAERDSLVTKCPSKYSGGGDDAQGA